MKRKLFHFLSVLFLLSTFSMCAPKDMIDVEVESVRLSNSTLTLAKGEKATLEVGVSPLNAIDYTIDWYVGDNSVANIVDGEVTAVEVGETIITAKCGAITTNCLVRVVPLSIPLENMDLLEKKIDVELDKSVQLTLSLTPENTTQQVKWSSSDETIATVYDGKVFGRKKGSATITATAGDKTASVEVNVVPQAAKVTSLKFKSSSIAVSEGVVRLLEVEVKSNDPENVQLTWTSSDESIVKVLDGRITAVSKGEATITVSSGSLEDVCTVKVVDKDSGVASLSLNKEKVTIKEKHSVTLVALVEPEEFLSQLEWHSEDESIATVSEYGLVRSLKPGTTKIIVSVAGFEASCIIEVEKAFDPSEFIIDISNIGPLTADVTIKAPSEETTFVYGLLRKFQYDGIVERWGSKYAADYGFWEEFGDQAFYMDLNEGSASVRLIDLASPPVPNTEYMLYCYGVDKNTKEMTSPTIERVITTHESLPSSNEISFTMEEITPVGIVGEIKTTNMDGYYISLQRKSYVDYFEERYQNGEIIDGLDARTYMIQAMISGDLMQEVPWEKLIKRGDFKIVDGYFVPKPQNVEYVLIIVGYDLEIGIYHEPIYYHFTTGSFN